MSTLIKRLMLVLPVLLALALLAPAAYAAEPRTGDNITVAANETIDDDAYLFGQNIIINGTVRGDVVAMGQTVVVNGVVDGALMTAGSSVTINGRVGRSVRAAGYSVNLGPQAQIGKDVLAGAYSVIADTGSKVQGDMWVGSYQARLNGEVGQDYRGGHTALELNGVVKGDVYVQVEGQGDSVPPSVFMPQTPGMSEVPMMLPGLRVGDNAQIGGELRYVSSASGFISPEARIQGGVEKTINEAIERARLEAQIAVERANSPMARLIRFGQDWATLLIVGLLLVWLANAFITTAAETVTQRPWPSLGWGFVSLIGLPVIMIVILLISIMILIVLGVVNLGGLGAATFITGLLANGGLLLVFVTTLAWFSKVVIGLTLGQWTLNRLAAQYAESRVWPLVVGVTLLAVVLALFNLVPGLGGVVNLLVSVWGLGALVITLWNRRGGQPIAQPLPTPAPMPAR